MVTYINENNILKISVVGKIDTITIPIVESSISDILSNNTFSSLILDAEKIEYISSVGLRLVLKLKKTYPDFKVINVSNDVYDLFEMTGFTEIITIERGLRTITIDGCEIIGEGANGKVYRIGPDQIVKVYKQSISMDDIKRERELARKAFVLGIPTAISYDIVKVDDYYGSIFELLDAESYSKLIATHPENLDIYIQQYANLVKTINSTEVNRSDMPDKRIEVKSWVKRVEGVLKDSTIQKLYSMIDNLPERTTMIHGDCHTKNILSQNDEMILIDMDTLSYGHPIFELCAIFLAYQGYSFINHNQVKIFQGFDYETSTYLWRSFLKLYFDTQDENYIDCIENKCALIIFTRLLGKSIRNNELENAEEYKKEVERRIDIVNSLDF